MSLFPSRFSLQFLLTIDALTCTSMGSLLTLGSRQIEHLTQIDEPLLVVAGIVLFTVAALMAFCSRMASVPAWLAQLLITGNVLWVLASLLLPVLGLVSPNATGLLLLVLQASAVALLSAFEYGAIRRTANPARIINARYEP